jgi:hypothetical protein
MGNRNKIIEYLSLPRTILLLCISWGFVAIGIWTKELWSALFFGLCGAVFSLPFLDPRKQVVFIGTKKYEECRARELDAMYNDPGIFTYTDDGFTINIDELQKQVRWDEIDAIFSYMVDPMYFDMDVHYCGNNKFTIDDDVAGWSLFMNKLTERFPCIDKQWDVKIMNRTFATNLTLVYIKDTGKIGQLAHQYYENELIINRADFA